MGRAIVFLWHRLLCHSLVRSDYKAAFTEGEAISEPRSVSSRTFMVCLCSQDFIMFYSSAGAATGHT